jgi:hypothetical protein
METNTKPPFLYRTALPDSGRKLRGVQVSAYGLKQYMPTRVILVEGFGALTMPAEPALAMMHINGDPEGQTRCHWAAVAGEKEPGMPPKNTSCDVLLSLTVVDFYENCSSTVSGLPRGVLLAASCCEHKGRQRKWQGTFLFPSARLSRLVSSSDLLLSKPRRPQRYAWVQTWPMVWLKL